MPFLSGTAESLSEQGQLLRAILREDRLKPHFQPILDLRTGHVHAFEGLIRGPSDSLLHAPASLFKVAGQTGQIFELEGACCRTLLRAYAKSGQSQITQHHPELHSGSRQRGLTITNLRIPDDQFPWIEHGPPSKGRW